jgi:hypothetical protein
MANSWWILLRIRELGVLPLPPLKLLLLLLPRMVVPLTLLPHLHLLPQHQHPSQLAAILNFQTVKPLKLSMPNSPP